MKSRIEIIRLRDLVGWSEQRGFYRKEDEKTMKKLEEAGIYVNADKHTIELRNHKEDNRVLVIFANYLLVVYIIPPEKEMYLEGIICHPFHNTDKDIIDRALNLPVVTYNWLGRKYLIRWGIVDDIERETRSGRKG
jgi:hypothetical protein